MRDEFEAVNPGTNCPRETLSMRVQRHQLEMSSQVSGWANLLLWRKAYERAVAFGASANGAAMYARVRSSVSSSHRLAPLTRSLRLEQHGDVKVAMTYLERVGIDLAVDIDVATQKLCGGTRWPRYVAAAGRADAVRFLARPAGRPARRAPRQQARPSARRAAVSATGPPGSESSGSSEDPEPPRHPRGVAS